MPFTDPLSSRVLDARLLDSLNYFLIEISGKTQLTSTHRKKAEGHYEAMAELLKNSPASSLLNRLDIKMIPFGGLGSNTATKPHTDGEFDLDLIVRFLALRESFGNAGILYGSVYDRLKFLDGYRDKLEKKDRCIRVHYAGDFYLDLMPATVESTRQPDAGKLWVPERQAGGTHEFILVDPIGLMKWFEDRCKLASRLIKADMVERGDFEAMPLITEEAKKPILKQAVQLLKRARDVYFVNDADGRKILKSVVILTVAGNAYEGEVDLYQLIEKILRRLDHETQSLFTASIKNPVNSAEDFLDSLRRKPERYQKLKKFIANTLSDWTLLSKANQDLDFRKDALNRLFGETVTKAVLSEYGDRIEKAQKDGAIRMAPSGMLGISIAKSGMALPRHQFYGDQD